MNSAPIPAVTRAGREEGEMGLYFGDNGRVTCGALRCAGMTAHSSGMRRDLGGGAMERISPADVREAHRLGLTLACEGCGTEASALYTAAPAAKYLDDGRMDPWGNP